jgi:hypothetical protein
MPYEMKCDGDSCNVYKQGSDKPKNGKPMSKDAAKKYMAALYANTEGGKKDLSDLEYAVIEEKCYSDSYAPYVDKLTQEQARYDPLGGRTGAKACANCRWFNVGSDSCYVVSGPIVPTGVSDMWMETPPPWKPDPMPVVIVDNTSAGEKAGAETRHSVQSGNHWPGDPVNPASPNQLQRIAQGFKQRIEAVFGGKAELFDNAESGFKVLPEGRWIGWWTNNARDKTGEQFTMKAIDGFIARVDSKAVPYPELWHKHLHIPMGRADSLARIGYLGFATGTFYDTPTGESGRKAYEADQAAGKPKTMSHQFLYPKSMKRDGVIHAFNSFELSVLDAGEEANPITKFGVKSIMKVVLDEKKRAELLDKFGGNNEYVDKLLNFASDVGAKMEAAGLDLKSLEAVDDLLSGSEDQAAQVAVKELGEATLTGFKALTQQIAEITSGIKTAQEEQATKLAATEKAVTDLKAYIEKEMGYTPRASRAERTALKPNNPQVAHLKTENAKAGKKSVETEPTAPETGGAPSILDAMLEAVKQGR